MTSIDQGIQAPQNEEQNSVNHQWNLGLALRMEWLGQFLASTCWIASVFAYGISSTGDVLQLAAASMWFIANIAALRCSTD